MRKLYSATVIPNCFKLICITLILVTVLRSSNVMGQVATYTQEVFPTSIPNSGNVNRRVTTTDWLQSKVTGNIGAPNDFEWLNWGTNPVAVNQNIAGFAAGAGFVRYVNRAAAYPAASGAPNGASAFLASCALDFSSHTIYNAATDTFGISVFRDGTPGALLSTADYIEVYIHGAPDVSNATLLTEKTTGSTKIYRSSAMAPAGAVANAFNRYQYGIPDLPWLRSATGGYSEVYIIIAAYSAGGNNIYIDNFNFPQWTSPMSIVSSNIVSQQFTDVGRSSTGNEIACIRVVTKGSTAPLKVDVASFTPAGSTSFATDVLSSNCYYTGASWIFDISGNAVQMPQLPVNSGPLGNGYLAYGWGSGACTPAAPASMTLNPGQNNYIWITYDIAPGAPTGNYVGCDFECVTSKNGVCNNYGLSGLNDASPQTFNSHRQIDLFYPIPYYGWPCIYNFWGNAGDCISAVNMPGDNGTVLNNYDHDGVCSQCIASPPSNPSYCNRLSCNPFTFYTKFAPVNVSTFKNRLVQLSAGHGKRGTGSAYQLKVQAGTWYSFNNIGVFIDWNRDGDFDDTYNGPGGIISESYGTHTMLGGDLINYPIPVWPANSTWNIDVPNSSGETVTDGGTQPCSDCSRNTSQIMLGNVRMRIREVYYVNPVNPITSLTGSGEVEDYSIQLLDNCPSPALNICKWIGQTNDWSDAANWCPAIPTINDIAYISVQSAPYVYPTIKENTTAVCRMLKIMDNGAGTGAQVNIDTKINGVLKVADDIIIGDGAPLSGSTAALNVNSSFNTTLTIPGKSALPPLGIALVPQTPFRTSAHAKTQIAYTASELSGTYGLKPGDIIDQLSIEVSSIAGGAAAASSYPNFQIVAYLTNAPVTFPYPAPAFTKIAVAAGDANVQPTWPRTIFSAAPLTLNMPNGTGGTQANGNYYTFNLNANTLVWDGLSNLVLSFEYKTTAGLNPPRSYVLYNEASPAFSVLSISHASAGATVTGWNIDGAGHYAAGSVAGPTAIVSNQRPRLDFKWHHPYQKATVIVGGDWINNNKGIYAPLTVQGSAGFKGGYSLVSFNPVAAMRSTVISPGLASVNAWNPVVQPVSLAGAFSDINQEITSNNDAHTVFNMLEIDKTSATGSSVLQNSFTSNVMGACADSLALTNGEFNLNRKEFTILNSNAASLARTNGWIRSEDNAGGVLAGNFQSKFTWKIGTGTTGTYTVPFKGAPANVFNFVYTKTVAGEDAGNLSVATYGTPAPDNVPYPKAPQTVASMTTNPSPVVDATPWTVDRFWYLSRSTTGFLTGSMRFEYDNAEGTLIANYVSNEMRAQRYEVTGWHAPYPGQSDASAPGKSWVNHPASFIDPAYNIWVVIHTNALQAPLPLTITNFEGKQVDTKVKLWWEVQSEADVVKYSVDRTVDRNFYQLIADKKPVGPSNSILNYEVWDNKPLKGIQYYRLASNNADGSVKYYGPVTINFGTQNMFEITNVVADNEALIKVDFNYDSNLPYTYVITDLLGNTVAKGDNQNAVAGENSIVIPVKLSQGIYIVSLINTDKAVSRKLVY